MVGWVPHKLPACTENGKGVPLMGCRHFFLHHLIMFGRLHFRGFRTSFAQTPKEPLRLREKSANLFCFDLGGLTLISRVGG